MDDLAKKLNDLLNSPDGMKKIQEAAASLGVLSGGSSSEQAPDSPSEPVTGSAPSSASLADSGLLGDMDSISKIMPLLSGLKGDDENTVLLKALRPYLQNERQQRLDETIKIMHMLKLLPLLGDKGIF